MKKYIIALGVFAFAFMASGVSQEDEHKKDRRAEMKALEIAFITEKLDLTPEESQQFWPVHNAFEEKERNIRAELRRSRNMEEMTDQQANDFVSAQLNADQEMLKLKKQYVKDLKPILPPKKIALLFTIEHEFKRKMLKNIREKRKEKHKN